MIIASTVFVMKVVNGIRRSGTNENNVPEKHVKPLIKTKNSSVAGKRESVAKYQVSAMLPQSNVTNNYHLIFENCVATGGISELFAIFWVCRRD